MLVLTRKHRESVVVGMDHPAAGTVKVVVLGIGPSSVRLGFEAERSVIIRREEAWGETDPDDATPPPSAESAETTSELDRWEVDGGSALHPRPDAVTRMLRVEGAARQLARGRRVDSSPDRATRHVKPPT